jgi:hypothetical protein
MWFLNAKNGAQTKRPKTKPLWTKRQAGQNVQQDKTCGRTKRPADKTSSGTKHPADKASIWVMFNRALLGNIFTEKSIECEGKIRQYIHSILF